MSRLLKLCLVFGFAGMILVSCKDKISDVTNDQTADPVIDAENKDIPPPDRTLTLNNGAKWVADPATTSRMNDIITLINNFPASEDARDFENLRTELNTKLTELRNNHQVEGEALVQFKNYIIGLRPLLVNLGAPEVATKQQAVEDLKKYLQSYHDYFS